MTKILKLSENAPVKSDWKMAIVLVAIFLLSPFLYAQSNQPVETPRNSTVKLTVPQASNSFTFLIFADRTTGLPEDISILKDAVVDANRLSPDFVMNIGDMVQGYNSTEQWMEQMKEYKSVMNELKCSWFPTAGNHDIYAGRFAKDLPKKQHEKEYEENFGPLWYAFEYKNYWFIVLYTDEGNPETDEKNFKKPECQRMSDAQFSWLKSVLNKAKTADGVFIFQHHPRWLGGSYGNDWDKVHTVLVETGNVKAVFAGHIHRMTYNEKDGIKYITLATTGGKLERIDSNAGLIHEIHHVSLRKNAEPEITILPVKVTLDVTAMPSRQSEQNNNVPKITPLKTETDKKTKEEKPLPGTVL
ncbi:MAG: metallophosphoesterase [Planctomycetaceae bacterium]|jgi:predicted MPP superfamily phosphohydrolase|nr:metallophosphoesterase [Planctomycetaceae bacterium]